MILKRHLTFSDIVKLVSMGLSTISIHMATLQWQGSSPSKNVVFSLLIQLIRGPIIVTCIIFKTGTLALVFSTLKYGGIVIAALWMVPATLIFIQLIRERNDEGLQGEDKDRDQLGQDRG